MTSKEASYARRVDIYTDGSCVGHPGYGGWAALLVYKNNVREVSGESDLTTSYTMELTAIKEALKLLKSPCAVSVYTDSQLIVDIVEKGWLEKWRNNGWEREKHKEVLNKELWIEIYELMENHTVQFKIKDPACEFCKKCDKAAQGISRRLAKQKKTEENI